MDEVCYISYKYQPPNNLAQTSIILHKRSLRHFKTNYSLHRKSFSKHPILTAFSVFSNMSDVCNISSKCWVPNKSANKIFLRKTT